MEKKKNSDVHLMAKAFLWSRVEHRLAMSMIPTELIHQVSSCHRAKSQLEISLVSLATRCSELNNIRPPKPRPGELRLLLQVLLELLKAHLIGILKLPIFLPLLLYRIIGQMHQLILHIIKSELLTSRPYVTLFEPVAFHVGVVGGYEGVAADVEFAFLDSK